MERTFIAGLGEANVIIRRIENYQLNPYLRPLTCGLNGEHDKLIPVLITLNDEKDRHQVILRCNHKNCKFEKHAIPEFLLHDDH